MEPFSINSHEMTNQLNLIKIYDLTENYEEMMNQIFELSLKYEINNEEVDIITRCFKSLIGSKRKQYRKISALIYKETLAGGPHWHLKLLNDLKAKQTIYIMSMCEKAIQICQNFLANMVDADKNKKSKLYFQKNVADHLRYIYEINDDDESRYKAAECYKEALQTAEIGKFLPTDITYLTFFLNYTVFLYDVQDDKVEAVKRAKIVLNDALKNTDEITENSQRDIILICQMIKDNLALWKHNIADLANT
jgi:14-3-3 protein epsilon